MTRPFDVAGMMSRLGDERPIFHSEADFQFALAWLVKQSDPTLEVRLEVAKQVVVDGPVRRQHLDLLVRDPATRRGVAIELKFLPPRVTTMHRGEEFDLRDGGADDSARYDFIKDLVRLEGFVADDPDLDGIAIFLTGKPQYWLPRRGSRPTTDEEFRIHQGRELCGRMRWGVAVAESTRAARSRELGLRGSYMCEWADYSEELGHRWRYLAIEVPRGL